MASNGYFSSLPLYTELAFQNRSKKAALQWSKRQWEGPGRVVG